MIDGPTIAILGAVFVSQAAIWYELGRLRTEVKHIRIDINNKS